MIGVRKIFWNPTLNFIGFNLLNVGRILSNTERRPSNYSDTKKTWFRLVCQVLINMSRIHKINRFSLFLRNIRSLRLPKIKNFRTEFYHRLQTIHIFLNAKQKFICLTKVSSEKRSKNLRDNIFDCYRLIETLFVIEIEFDASFLGILNWFEFGFCFHFYVYRKL